MKAQKEAEAKAQKEAETKARKEAEMKAQKEKEKKQLIIIMAILGAVIFLGGVLPNIVSLFL